MAPSVCVLGSVNMDLVVRAPRFPRPGETLLGSSFATCAGGKGANQAIAAARLFRGRGGRVRMVARVGDDPDGTSLRALLAGEGVEIEHVTSAAGERTGVAVITVDARGENTIVVASGANAGLAPAHVEAARDLLAGCEVLVLQLEVPLDAVAAAARIARAAGRRVLLNAAPARELPGELLRAVDVLVVNEGEARALLSGSAGSPGELARRLAARGPRAVVVTLAARGALLVEGGRERAQPSFPVQVVDTTAAGDAFAGALACALAEGRSWEDALRSACAAGALATTRVGAVPSLPDAAAVESLLRAAPSAVGG